MPLRIQHVSIREARAAGLDDLVFLHWQEVMRDGIPLDISWDRYERMERAGEYTSLAAFDGQNLVGYNGCFIFRPMHHNSTAVASNDVLYLDPDHRFGLAGIQLIKHMEDRLRGIGVRRIVYSAKANLAPGSSGANLAALLRRLDYGDVETVHERLL